MGPFISQVQIPVRDIEASIDWYVHCLGCESVAKFYDFAVVGFAEGTNLFLWETEDRTTSNFTVNGSVWPVIGIEVDDLDELISKVIASGVEYEGDGSATLDADGGRSFKFYDLNGNMLEAHQEPAEAENEIEEESGII